ncbi:argininosuccinate lyase, chloroplastic [Senna tora]|uniref:Argininosuccinate lyase, chloroplastic n=1 Tax=Senna tora TaxID=362788 RepID=A0A834WRT1_9FABA|nr:argininosuccinate lyase, chloroplastic [Senna tora]
MESIAALSSTSIFRPPASSFSGYSVSSTRPRFPLTLRMKAVHGSENAPQADPPSPRKLSYGEADLRTVSLMPLRDSQSRSPTISSCTIVTDFRLWCRDAIDKILARIKHLQVSLVTLALKNEGLIVPGYTHLQRAQPVLLRHLLLAYAEELERDAGRLVDYRARMNFCPLGACALAGTGLPIDGFMTSDALGFTAPLRTSIDAVSDRDFVLDFLSVNAITAVHLSRLGEEWVLWATEH